MCFGRPPDASGAAQCMQVIDEIGWETEGT